MHHFVLYQIACLHTAESNVAASEAALHELAIRAQNALLGLCNGSDAALLTCSALGPAIEGLAGTRVPVMRVDEALAYETVRNGGEVVVLYAVETPLVPTRSVFEQAASLTGARIDLRKVQGAWAAFKAGQPGRWPSGRQGRRCELDHDSGSGAVVQMEASRRFVTNADPLSYHPTRKSLSSVQHAGYCHEPPPNPAVKALSSL